jgi:hypothetical protein
MKIARRILALAAALVTAGCSPTTEGHPESSPPPPPATSSAAPTLAPIEGFPDMSSYIKSNRRDYLVVSPGSPGLYFLTPDGMSCWLGAVPTAEQAYASCTGSRPDMGGGDWEVEAERNEQGRAEVAPPPAPGSEVEAPPKPLPAMHLLQNDADQFCGVDDKGTVACRVGDHGFVLTPTSTMLF